jgi:choline dehydrogenase-like flavoprotein
MAAIVDTFLPGVDGLPSASELGVHTRFLAEVDALDRPSLRRELHVLLAALGTGVGTMALGGTPRRPRAFPAMDQRARETWLARLATSPIGMKRTAFQDLKRVTFLLAYGMDSPWRDRTGYVDPPLDLPSPTRLRVRTPRPGEPLEADVVVIGSGPGGGVTAAHLAAAGWSVLVLETAAMVDETRFGEDELQGLADLFLDRGLSATHDRWIAIRAGRAVGGGSVVNWSSSLRPPDEVREEWRAAGITDDLDEHLDAVERDLGVTTAESPHNGSNARLAAGLDAMGLPWRTIPRNVRGCGDDCGPCAIGCRRGAKQSSLRHALATACAHGAEVLDRTEALRITMEDGRATGVVARVPGGEVTIRARHVALAGGSMRSPAVLQRSGIAPDTAGRFLLLHPVAVMAGVYDEPQHPWSGVPQSVMSAAYATVAGSHGFRIEAAPAHPGLLASGLPWPDSATHRETITHAAHIAPFIAIVRDQATGRVDLAKDGGVTVRYAPGTQERELLRRAALELARIHRAAGARRLIPLVTPPLEWREGEPFDPWLAALKARPVAPNTVLLFTAHQLSSNRIGTDPRTSVADPDGQVHGVRGLWITDASALPTATGVNPMLSLMALARRTASRMAAAG